MVPVRFQDQNGHSIIPVNSNLERDIALQFIGKSLFFPITAVTIVVGEGFRDLYLTVNNIHVKTKVEKARMVYQHFGSEIENLSNDNFPEEVIEMYKKHLLESMEKMLKACQ